jgi:hypothetical protein
MEGGLGGRYIFIMESLGHCVLISCHHVFENLNPTGVLLWGIAKTQIHTVGHKD